MSKSISVCYNNEDNLNEIEPSIYSELIAFVEALNKPEYSNENNYTELNGYGY